MTVFAAETVCGGQSKVSWSQLPLSHLPMATQHDSRFSSAVTSRSQDESSYIIMVTIRV